MFAYCSDFIRICLKLRLQAWLKKYLVSLWLQLKREERWGIKAVFLWVCATNWRLLWQQAWRGHDKHAPDLWTSNTTFQLGLQDQRINHVTALWPPPKSDPMNHNRAEGMRGWPLTFVMMWDLVKKITLHNLQKCMKSMNDVNMRDVQVTQSKECIYSIKIIFIIIITILFIYFAALIVFFLYNSH